MSFADASLIILSILFGVYGVFCAVECGIALTMFRPGLGGPAKNRKKLAFTPLWEITNVFLAFGFIGFAVLFSNGLKEVSSAILSTLSVGFVALLARACLALYIFYQQKKEISNWVKALFLLSNFAIPLSFAGAGAYLLTGQTFWQSGTGWLLMLAAFLGLLSVGLAFNSTRRGLVSNLFAMWLLVLCFAVPRQLANVGGDLRAPAPLAVFVLIGGLLLLATAISDMRKAKSWVRYYAAVIGFLAPLCLIFSIHPYLVAGKLSLNDAFGAQAYAPVVLTGLFAALPLIAIGFYVFGKLLKMPVLDKPL